MAALAASLARVVRRPRNDTPVPYVSRGSDNRLSVLFDRPRGQEAQMRAMGAVGTLFAIVNRTSTSTAAVDWGLWRKAPSGRPEDRVEVTRHAALDTWNTPNDFFTREELVETGQQHLDLTGESWTVLASNPLAPSLPLEMWPVRPDRMFPVPSRDKFVAGYVYVSPDGEQVPLERDKVIFIRMPNPLDPYRGMGPVQSILTDLNTDTAQKEWNQNFFRNSAEPGGILEVEKRLSDDEFSEMSERWREQHKGVGNAHRVAIIEQGHWVDRNISQRDMQFVEGMGITTDAILRAFGMPKFAIGMLDDVNRASADASDRWFDKHFTVTRLERFKQALNRRFLPRFGTAASGLEFDFVNPVGADAELENAERDSKVQAVTALIGAGFDRAEVLAAFELPDIAIGSSTAPAASATGATPAAIAEMVQKIYLGVGAVITWEEARALLVSAGADLNLAAPPPALPAPARPALAPAARHALPAGRRPRNAPDLDPEDLPDVTPLQGQWQAALDDLLDEWQDISEAQKAELVAEVRRIAETRPLSDLAGLSVDSTDGAAALAAAMVAVAALAAGRVVAEAAEQDVTIKPRTPADRDLERVATVAAASLASLLALSAVAAAMRANGPAATPEHIADAVAAALDELTDATPRAWLGGALTGAQNAGRVETLSKAGTVGAIYSNEANDASTCPACSSVNGTWLGNTDDMDRVLAAYPGGAYGGYVDCAGRERCRGTIVGVWR